MSDIALEQCGGYDLLENLCVKNRPLTNHVGFQMTDIAPFQSDTDDEKKGEKESIPFLNILQQQGIDPKVQEMQVQRKSKGSSSVSATEELFQENKEGENPFEISNTGIRGKSQCMGKNPYASPSFMEKSDGFSTLTQKSEMGVERDFSGTQIINPIDSATLLPTIFREYPESDIQTLRHSPLLKNRTITTNIHFNLDNNFLSHSENNNSSAVSLPAGGVKETDSQKNEKFIYLHNSGFLFTTETTFKDSLTAETARKRLDIGEAKLLTNHKTRQKTGQSVFGTIQASGFAASHMSEFNIKELPAAFKSLSHQVVPESVNTSVVPVVNALTNTGEKYTKNDLSKINGDAASQQNISVVPQTNKEAGNFMTGQENAGYTPDDAQLQRTHKSHSFSADSQKTTVGTHAYTNDMQNNTELFFGNNVKQLPSMESLINSEIHTYRSSSAAGTEHLHGSIMEQLLQKISLVNHGDRSEIKLHLTPPELGSIKIHFTEENDEIEAKIFVEDAEVKAAIESNVHRLKESVAASGLEIHKFEVVVQHDKTHEEKYSDNSETKSQQYYHAKSQGGDNEAQFEQQNNISKEMKKEPNGRTSNVMVDYII